MSEIKFSSETETRRRWEGGR